MMMKNWSKRLMIPVLFTIIVNSTLLITIPSKADYVHPFFRITLLTRNDRLDRMDWVLSLTGELPKIGIGIDYIDFDNWDDIKWRFLYGSFPKPTYKEGGFDVIFMRLNYGHKLFYDSNAFYSTEIGHYGNFYQYSNPEMDGAIENYKNAFTVSDRLDWATEIQNILYNDMPDAPILYEKAIYLFDENLVGWDPLLWYHTYEPMANWSISGQTELHYVAPVLFYNGFHPFAFNDFWGRYEGKENYMWLHQIYNGLVELTSDNNYNWNPWLCESFTTLDGLTYDVIIKDDACWADGVDLTTDDVIFNYQLAVNMGIDWEDFWDGASITKINDKEFTITFKTSYITRNGENLDLNLIPKHIWENVPENDQRAQAENWTKNQPEKMFGAGPYMLANYNENDGVIHLSRNPYFDDWSGITPHFTDIYFLREASKEIALENLELAENDIIDVDYSLKFEDLFIPGTRYQTFLTSAVEEMVVNCLHPYIGTGEYCPISSPESASYIRKAINHVIPRQYIISEILDGFGDPGVTAYPSVCIGFNDTLLPYDYDLEKATHYMELAGFDFHFWTPPLPPNYFPLVVTSLCCFSSLLLMVLIFMSIHLTAIFRRKE